MFPSKDIAIKELEKAGNMNPGPLDRTFFECCSSCKSYCRLL